MITPAPPGAITSAKDSRAWATPSQVDGHDPLRRGLHRGQPGGVGHGGHGSEGGGGRRQVVDRGRVGDIHLPGGDVEVFARSLAVVAASAEALDVGQEHRVVVARSPDDCLAHPADPGHHQHVLGHRPEDNLNLESQESGSLGETMSTPLRVVQWATGNIGTKSLRAVIEHPDLELVGAVRALRPPRPGRTPATCVARTRPACSPRPRSMTSWPSRPIVSCTCPRAVTSTTSVGSWRRARTS